MLILTEILETKTSLKKPGPPEISTELKEWKYKRFANAEKAGYAGTAILSKHKPIAFTAGIGKSKHDQEGRVVTAEVNFKVFAFESEFTGIRI